jgi:hypothetical protein
MTAHKLQVAQEMHRSGQDTTAAIATTLGAAGPRSIGTSPALIAGSVRSALRGWRTVGTWNDPGLGRPMAAPLERYAQLLGVDLARVHQAALGEWADRAEHSDRGPGRRQAPPWMVRWGEPGSG